MTAKTTTAEGEVSRKSLFGDMLRGSGLYSLALMAPRLSSLVLVPVFTRFLLPAEYGTLDILDQITSVIGILAGWDFSAALGYHYFAEEEPARRNRVASTAITGAALFGVIAAALVLLAAGPVSRIIFGRGDLDGYLRIAAMTMALGFVIDALFTWLRVENRPGIFLIHVSLRTVLAMVLILTFLVGFRWGIWGVLTSNLLTSAAIALALLVFAFRRLPVVLDGAIFIRMFRFALPLTLSGLAFFIMHFGDRFFLVQTNGLADVGVYAIAYKAGMLVSLAAGAFQNYWVSQVYVLAKRSDGDHLIAQTFTYYSLAICFAGLGLIAIARPAILLLTTPAYHGAIAIVPVIVFAYVLRAIGDFFRAFFFVHSRTTYDAIVNWIGTAVCLAAYALLIPRFGIWGAATATLITFAALSIVTITFSMRLRKIPVEGARLAKVYAPAIALAVMYPLLPHQALVAEFLTSAALILALPLVLVLLRFASPAETGLLREIYRSRIVPAMAEKSVSAIFRPPKTKRPPSGDEE